jgi:hypothetical protein
MHLRRTSVSLPTVRHPHASSHDPHEKPGRYYLAANNVTTSRSTAGFIARARIAWMAQSQRAARWAKTAVVVGVLLALLYWLSPQTKELYKQGEKGIL